MMNFGDFSVGDYNAGDLLWLGDWSPAWITLLVVLGTIIFAISAYDLRNLRALRRWTLVGLRVAVYALAVLLLLEPRSEEHTSELQSRPHLVCRLLLEKKNKIRHKVSRVYR